ncbi:MAG TPA: alpha-glucan family phosphorylase [Gemmatimonadales bacterium]|nr:alpha-glucan family phosphorylase [Gemmatimonadales bacterium]
MKRSSVAASYLPERIDALHEIATNVSWSWSRDARALFRVLDRPLWHLTRHNPLEQLRRVDPKRLAACARDTKFLQLYDRVLSELRSTATNVGTWFAQNYPDLQGRSVAYFCAEFGLHNSVPIYSGGLGVLAGDHCKASSDLGVPLVAVGLLYTQGYFDQRIRLDGWQEDTDERFDPLMGPLEPLAGPNGEPWLAVVRTGGRPVHVGAWRMKVGRVPVYLMDTDLEENDPADRTLASRLYAGGPEQRLRQEWALGVAGVRVLRAVGVDPGMWHANEGHAAFMLVERLREHLAKGTSLADAVKQVRATSLFTTHTPVPAGHDVFSGELIEKCTGPVWEEMGISRADFLHLGYHPKHDHGQFHMAVLAERLSSRINGVAKRHGEESRRIWHDLWPGHRTAQVPIGYVTNGVHLATWMSHRMMALLDNHLGPDWGNRLDDPALWAQVLTIDDQVLWFVHCELKNILMAFIREQARRRWTDEWKDSAHVVGAGTLLDPDALTIGFGRRFATYKRSTLIFKDIERLRKLLINTWRPVQIVFTGKAHPADEDGKKMLQQVYQFSRDPRLEGRVAFLEDYELHLAHRMIQGVDLWMNLPRPPLEACGTSGMKAALNAVPQLSTLDGWWFEAYDGLNGWAIKPPPEGGDGDDWDAEQLYGLLEDEVVPLFYDRDPHGVPCGWVDKMKHALRTAGERFTARRMVQGYVSTYYAPGLRGDGPADDPPSA